MLRDEEDTVTGVAEGFGHAVDGGLGHGGVADGGAVDVKRSMVVQAWAMRRNSSEASAGMPLWRTQRSRAAPALKARTRPRARR